MYGLLLITGILGSLHCIGMCGPLALSLPVPAGKSKLSVVIGRLTYHSGRILAYMSIGFVFGTLGGAIVIVGWQQALSIVAGSLLIVMALYKILGVGRKWDVGKGFSSWLSKQLSKAFNSRQRSSLFVAGMLNGYLPCGLVYMAAAMTVSFGGPTNASLGMALFGLGTFPVMFVMSMGTTWLPIHWKSRVNRYSVFFALLIGLLFVLRGMNLGIAYVSPRVDKERGGVECCEDEFNHKGTKE